MSLQLSFDSHSELTNGHPEFISGSVFVSESLNNIVQIKRT
jgi:hypothetical protein